MFSIIFHVFCYDIWFYASHLVLHIPKIYGAIHNIHHATPYLELNYDSTNKGHIAEHIIQPLGIFIPCFYSGVKPAYFFASFAIIGTRAMMRHDHRYVWLIGNHHLLHHKYPKYNFGEYWIDWIFGTLYPNSDEYIYGMIYT
jgi:sterol desaturase/sphingolipid hydroxylase (fatty acid hydroxylase superfamily)